MVFLPATSNTAAFGEFTMKSQTNLLNKIFILICPCLCKARFWKEISALQLFRLNKDNRSNSSL